MIIRKIYINDINFTYKSANDDDTIFKKKL